VSVTTDALGTLVGINGAGDSILLAGVNGAGVNAVTAADFILAA
jgi:hypothetical protein